jgi:hypothetical protein
MRSYNRALDCLALAATQLLKGRPVTASKFLMKATKMPDIVAAINIIEASNHQAYTQAKVQAAKAKPKQVRAAEDDLEDDSIKSLVGDDEDEIGGEEVDAEAEGFEGEPEEVEDEAIGHEDAEIAASLAKVLSSMTQRTAAKAKRR